MIVVSPPPDRIYLLRHAKSGWALPGQKDFDRTLNQDGVSEAEQVADLAANKGYRPDLVISSTAVRCRQTADAIRRVFPAKVAFRFAQELYNSTADNYLETLANLGDVSSVMLVGHNPAIEEVLETLVGAKQSRSAIPDGFPTAGLAVIGHGVQSGSDGSGRWTLSDFITS
ncbi:MAG: SixA phosphatase family protein [Allorhizobium sp.]